MTGSFACSLVDGACVAVGTVAQAASSREAPAMTAAESSFFMENPR